MGGVEKLGLKIGKREVRISTEVVGGIQCDEMQVSCDVKALFPSVPWVKTHEWHGRRSPKDAETCHMYE